MSNVHRIGARFLVAACISVIAAGCGSSSSDDIEYVAIGASDATGVGADPLDNGYVFLIDRRLEDQVDEDVDLTNLGIPGAETEEFAELELPVAVTSEPDLVTIWAGPNDVVGGVAPADFERQLDELLSELESETTAFVAIATIPDLTQLPRFQAEPDPDVTVARVDAFNDIIVRLAGRYDVAVVRLDQLPADASLVDADGFHPSNEGHEEIAEAFLDVIVPAFQQP